MAKFPFEEVPSSKQRTKPEACPPSGSPASAAPAALSSVGGLLTKTHRSRDCFVPQCCSLLFLSASINGFFLGSACVAGGPVQPCSPVTAASPLRRTNDQQLQEIKEVVEEAELARTMIHSLAQSSAVPIVTTSRSVTGSSSITSASLSKAKSGHLNDR